MVPAEVVMVVAVRKLRKTTVEGRLLVSTAVAVQMNLMHSELMRYQGLGLVQGEAWGSGANCQEDQPGRLCLRMNQLQDPCEVIVGSGGHLGLEVLGQGR